MPAEAPPVFSLYRDQCFLQILEGPDQTENSNLIKLQFDPDYFGANPSNAEMAVLCFPGIADPAVVASLEH